MPAHPEAPPGDVRVQVADEGFADYIAASDFSFEVCGYLQPELDRPFEQWAVQAVAPYRKCYGIDAQEFLGYRGRAESEVLMAYLGARAVGHLVVSTNWNGFAHVDELAVDASARRSGVARVLLNVAQFWARKKNLQGVMLETQSNNQAACRLYRQCGYEVGGIDRLRYRGIDAHSGEVAIFWYLLFAG